MTRIALGLFLFSITQNSYGHGGGLDANGCHNNGTLGVYECHTGEHAGTTWESRDAFEIANAGTPDTETFNFIGEPDWSTLAERQVLFRQETVWTVSDGQYLYGLEREEVNGEYRFKPINRAKITTLDSADFAQLIQAIQNDASPTP